MPSSVHGPSPLADITAAILAGGLGSRLRGAIGERQKVAAEVGDRPFVAYLLDRLARAGIRTTVLCTGHRAEDVARDVGDTHRLSDEDEGKAGMRIIHSVEPRPLGTAGALAHALPHLTSHQTLVLNGDSYCGVDLHAFVAAVRASGAAGGIVLVRQDDTASYGRVELDDSGFVGRFVEKGESTAGRTATGPGWINAGVYLLGRELLEEIPRVRPVSLEREMFPRWIDRGLWAFPTDAPFLDIGTPERYAEARAFLEAASDADECR
ncbi:MAG: nucleotidyltransferase family protein [Planctomycetaceae bacterium]